MDLPAQALEMFRRFLEAETFHDVTLPTDGVSCISLLFIFLLFFIHSFTHSHPPLLLSRTSLPCSQSSEPHHRSPILFWYFNWIPFLTPADSYTKNDNYMASGYDRSSGNTPYRSAALLVFFALLGLICVGAVWKRKRYVRFVLHHRDGFMAPVLYCTIPYCTFLLLASTTLLSWNHHHIISH